ncbi:MAG: hypothetical protein WBQ94_04295 [Terracidiphilus sp.]
MCGASNTQTQLQDAQMQAYQQAQQMSAEQYANQQAIYGPMAKQFQSIFDLGPSHKGFSDEETNTLNAQAVQGTAANYGAAAKAVGESLAAEGGGNADITVGGQQQMKAEVAQSAAGQESQQETQIQEANYNQGYQQWLGAGTGLESIAAGQNPLGYMNAATSAGSAAGTTANQIAQEDNSWINAAIGAAGSLGSAAIGAWG